MIALGTFAASRSRAGSSPRHLRVHRVHHRRCSSIGCDQARPRRFADVPSRRSRPRGAGDRSPRRRPDLPRTARACLREHGDDRGRGHLERRPGVQPVEWKNARKTLVRMGVLSARCSSASRSWPRSCRSFPDSTEQTTVLADIGRTVYGTTPRRPRVLVLQVATMLILVLAANTAFADFPRLASFHAGDDFLPRQFTTRGHRLVFSNGIIALSAAASPSSSPSGGRHHADPVLRDRRLHLVHAVTGRHGEATPPDREDGWRVGLADQRRRARSRRAIVLVDHRHHEVHGRGLGDPRARARRGVAAGPHAPAVRGGRPRNSRGPGDVQPPGGRADRVLLVEDVDRKTSTRCSTRRRCAASARWRCTWRTNPKRTRSLGPPGRSGLKDIPLRTCSAAVTRA